MNRLLPLLLMIATVSACEKSSDDKTYIGYLSNKTIHYIKVINDTIWVSSSMVCDTCVSYLSSSAQIRISQLTMATGDTFGYSVQNQAMLPLVQDKEGRLYTAHGKKISRILGLNHFETVLETENYDFAYFAFDHDNNIWLSGYYGIAYWDKANLTIYNSGTNGTPNITHGLLVDDEDEVWVPFDYQYGLLKIEGAGWNYIPYSQMPKIKDGSYLSNPVRDLYGNVWFDVFRSDTTSSILRYDGTDWNYEYPNPDGTGWNIIDSEGTLWVIYNKSVENVYKSTYLAHYINDGWVMYNLTSIGRMVLTLDADDQYIYLGTISGLVKMEK